MDDEHAGSEWTDDAEGESYDRQTKILQTIAVENEEIGHG